MSKYKYSFHDERGEFSAYVEDEQGNTVWNVSYPDYYENVDGELIESSTIFEDGFMKDANDIEGLENYLKSLNILKREDELMDESGYMGKGEEDEEYQEMAKGGIVRYKKGDMVYILENYSKNPYQIPTQINGVVISYNSPNVIVKFEDGYTKTLNQRFLYKDDYADGGMMAKGAVADSYNVSVNKEISPNQINEFISYCNKFYGKAGIYREDFNGGFSVTEIKKSSSKIHIRIRKTTNMGRWRFVR